MHPRSLADGQSFVRQVSAETQNRVALETHEPRPDVWSVQERQIAYA